ncbi:MAG TPA: Na+/H+ antiporter NhaA, partial [Gemmatimonadaceae bacterium]|nr:Na+/H+ antiporter NhaA [Gemmatimonadaceae bacterium]
MRDSESTASAPGTEGARPRRRAYRVLRPFQEFARRGVLGGVLLLACTAIAMVWANSPLWESYHRLWETSITVGATGGPLTLSLHQWINDGLMAVFFLLVG